MKQAGSFIAGATIGYLLYPIFRTGLRLISAYIDDETSLQEELAWHRDLKDRYDSVKDGYESAKAYADQREYGRSFAIPISVLTQSVVPIKKPVTKLKSEDPLSDFESL